MLERITLCSRLIGQKYGVFLMTLCFLLHLVLGNGSNNFIMAVQISIVSIDTYQSYAMSHHQVFVWINLHTYKHDQS